MYIHINYKNNTIIKILLYKYVSLHQNVLLNMKKLYQ